MIPIFRAKKLDSDEYVQGWYSSPILISGKLYVSITNTNGEFSIDTTTLSIHFPDMIDSKGNKIFASLQEDGKGGDNVLYSDYKTIYTMVFDILKGGVYAKNISNEDGTGYKLNPRLKIIGIQQWS